MTENGSSSPQDSQKCPTHPGGDIGHPRAQTDFFARLGLSDLQLRAIELSVDGYTTKQIAAELSIDPKTLWRWKSFNQDYRALLDETRAQRYAVATDRYQNLLLTSTAVLAKHLRGTNQRRQFRAAAVLLNMAGAFRPLAKKIPENPLTKRLDPFDLSTLLTPTDRS